MKITIRNLLAVRKIEYLAVNQDFLILEISSKAQHFADCPAEIRLGRDVRIGFPELIGIEDILRDIFKGHREDFELKGICRSSNPSSFLYLDMYFILERNETNKDRLIVLLEDATERIILAQRLGQVDKEYSLLLSELSTAKDYLEKVIASMGDALLVATASGEIKKVNRATLDIFGYKEEELINNQLSILFDRDSQQDVWSPQFLSKNVEIVCQTKTGEKRYVAFFCSVIQSDTEESADFVCIGRDLTKHKQAERDRLLATIARQIRQSLKLEEILNTTVAEVRQLLQTDRVVIYRFNPDWSAIVAVESVSQPDWSILDKTIAYPCFGQSWITPYTKGRIQATADIYTSALSQCHVEFLAQLQIRANLVIPILLAEESSSPSPSPPLSPSPSSRLWGLLAIHHCRMPRQWEQWEIDLLKHLSEYLAIAIQQAQLYEQLRQLAISDGLTQLANRRRFDNYLNSEWRRLAREQQPLSLILCDLDYFKAYNDTYGHLAGDFCLQVVAGILRDVVKRPADLAARYGGEEFAVILPNTSIRGAVYIGEQIRTSVQTLKIPHSQSPIGQYVTLSLGVASQIPECDSTPKKLITAADRALYRAKAQGRDCAIAASD